MHCTAYRQLKRQRVKNRHVSARFGGISAPFLPSRLCNPRGKSGIYNTVGEPRTFVTPRLNACGRSASDTLKRVL